MKYRKDFVTNSSSSSFVVAFRTVPKSADELKKLLFEDKEILDYPYYHPEYDEPEDASFETSKIAKIIFDDMKKQTANDVEKIKDCFRGYLKGAPEYDEFNFTDEQGNKKHNWDAYKEACDKFRDINVKKFMDKFKNFKTFCFEYSDNEGRLGATMEHGDIFENLNHITISNH